MRARGPRLFNSGEVAARAKRLLPRVTVDITPDAGHGLAVQYPDRTTARILDFIDQIEP